MNAISGLSIFGLEKSRADLFYKQSINGTISNLINSSVIVIFCGEYFEQYILYPWYIAFCLLGALRICAFIFWRNHREKIESLVELKPWFYFMYLMLFMSGCLWGLVGYFCIDFPVFQQFVAIILLTTMLVGNIVNYISAPVGIFLFVVPVLSAWGAALFMSPRYEHQVMAGFILFYSAVLIFMARSASKKLIGALMTEAKLQENEERLRLSMEVSDCLTWDWNLIEDEFFWEGNKELFPKGMTQLQDMLWYWLGEKIDVDTEYRLYDDNRNSFYIAVRGRFHRDPAGKAVRFSGVCWNITAKKNQDILRQERDAHEAENRAKSNLLANASHELRTPLSIIMGYSEELLLNQSLDEKGREDLETISRQGVYMQTLISDLLDLSKISSGNLLIQSTLMDPISEIEKSIAAVKPLIAQKELKIDLSIESKIPVTMVSDASRFKQVLVNLLSNAIKFQSRGTIQVRTFMTMEDGRGYLRIQVVDRGTGIDQEQQLILFKPFNKHKPKNEESGAGLGLSLASNLMELMNGQLRLIKSTAQEGSTFEICFNLGPYIELDFGDNFKEHFLDRKPKHSFQDFSAVKVLVVDDSDDLRVLMTRSLERQGAQVKSCQHGGEAVEIVKNEKFDLVLMDIRMPIMDGYKATEHIRKLGFQDLIVAITAQASSEGKQESFGAGFDGYLSKPINFTSLHEIVKKKKAKTT